MNNKLPSTNLKYKRITITVPEELDLKFRSIASKKFKFEKGWYSKAFIESMENWITNNELTFIKRGTRESSRYMGSKMWAFFKNYENSGTDSDFKALDHVFDCFCRSSNIKDVQYKIGDDKFSYYIKCHSLSKKGPFDVENLMGNHIFPLTIISRAFMEDLTGEEYRVKSEKLGKYTKMELRKSKPY